MRSLKKKAKLPKTIHIFLEDESMQENQMMKFRRRNADISV
jgi:hypothetical protein